MNLETFRKPDLRYMYIGATKAGKGAVLESDLSPEQIMERADKGLLTAGSFTIHSTNWGGVDEISRICGFEGVVVQRKIPLNYELEFNGFDEDMGHIDRWVVKVSEICTVVKL